jgi:hypothetical protein
LMILTILGEDYKSCSSSLCSFLHFIPLFSNTRNVTNQV